MRLYHELADWWPLLSSPDDYRDEGVLLTNLLEIAATEPITSLLELGSGGGHIACWLPGGWDVVLCDLSEEMLAVSRRLNPARTHVLGDMRSMRLERTFDVVLIHDAVMYMTTEDDLGAALLTAVAHARPGGLVVVIPDHVRENFAENVSSGGSGDDERSAQMLEWCWDPDPDDDQYEVDFAFLIRDDTGVRHVHDSHTFGHFTRETWWRLIRAAGLEPTEADPLCAVGLGEVFLARKPVDGTATPT